MIGEVEAGSSDSFSEFRIVGLRTSITIGVGEVMKGVSPPAISMSGGGSRLAQITAVALGFVSEGSVLGGISSLLFGRRDERREHKSVRMYHSLRYDWAHRLRKEDKAFPRNRRKDSRVNSIIPTRCDFGCCLYLFGLCRPRMPQRPSIPQAAGRLAHHPPSRSSPTTERKPCLIWALITLRHQVSTSDYPPVSNLFTTHARSTGGATPR